jgi:lipopolysaccharide/colanic/teichoic acid biosynthesis glycosyltransferase
VNIMLFTTEPTTTEQPDRPPTTAAGPFRLGGWYLTCKLVAEFCAALILLVLASPFLLLAALLVKLTSRGPAFYSQTRLGKDGRPYTIYKIRTMVTNAEAGGPRWAMPNDTRVTPLGRFLRDTHLDELPQLWNVLKGDMSLVGPRPERPEFVPQLERNIPHYRDRLRLRPGITGLAQVQLPADTDLESVRRKLVHDLYYVRHLNPLLDLQILGCTAFKLLHMPFTFSSWLLRVPHGPVVEADAPEALRQPRAAQDCRPAPVSSRLPVVSGRALLGPPRP